MHLVVSTYKEAARLVSTVGEHSAVFAQLRRFDTCKVLQHWLLVKWLLGEFSLRLFCSVLSVLRLSVLVVVAVGRFAPITVLQTLSWLLSSVSWCILVICASRHVVEQRACRLIHNCRLCSQVLLAVSFAWGPVLLDILQSLVLLLHVNPFDTGDMIIFRGNYLHVQQIKLLNTVFRDLCDEVLGGQTIVCVSRRKVCLPQSDMCVFSQVPLVTLGTVYGTHRKVVATSSLRRNLDVPAGGLST